MHLQDGDVLAEGSRELALLGAALTLAGLALTPLCTTLARRFSPKAPVFFARWRFFHAGLVVGVLLLSASVAGALVQGAFPPERVPKGLAEVLASVLTLGATSVFILALAAKLDPDGIRSLGLRVRGSARAALVALGSFLLLWPGLFGLQILWPWLLEALGGEYAPQAIAESLRQLSGGGLLLAAFLVIVVQPFLEELIFRGFLQPLLVQNLGDRGGVFLASLIFALPHGDSAFLPIFGLALLLGALMLRTQRLAAPWAVHAVHNAIAFLLLDYPASG
jgi:membrane protease YdiL (CAAX protease family)